ncbi:MAG: hypothetical protein WBF04_06355 [Candidatus Sulfotelmatobacter sp.]
MSKVAQSKVDRDPAWAGRERLDDITESFVIPSAARNLLLV